MKNRASAAPIFAAPASPRLVATHPWHERLWLRAMGLPTIEEAERRLRSRPGFIASLTPEQIEEIMSTDEFEVLGSPNGPKRNC